MTKRLLLSTVALVSLVSYSALAAPPAYDWSGFYIGANAGGGWGSVKSNYDVLDTLLLNDPSASGRQSMSGIVGGVQAGYNWQVGNWVYGLATDFQVSSLASEAVVGVPITVVADPVIATVTDDHSVKLPWFGTARGSIGFTPANDWRVYATGGLAYGGIDESNTVTSPFIGAGSHDLIRAGWTVGGGIATALSPRWSAQLQYLYLDFGSFTDTVVSSDGLISTTINSRLTDNVVTVGLNYSFAPVPPPSPPILRK